MAFIDTDFGQPLIFRTVDENVFKASIEEGSIWLRSNEYYQTLENKARQDTIEGISGTAMYHGKYILLNHLNNPLHRIRTMRQPMN